MKRNTALFGASLVAGVAAASGLIMTSNASSAAPGDTFGVVWHNTVDDSGSNGAWVTGAYGNDMSFSGSASAGKGTFQLSAFPDAPTVTVSVACDGADPVTTVTGGGAAGTYAAGKSVPLNEFSGVEYVIGTVTFGSKTIGDHSVGAYIAMGGGLGDSYVALTGIDCEAAPTSSSTTPSSSSSTTPSSSSSTTPSSSTTNPPSSSTTNPPSSSTTAPPSSSTTAPPSSTTTNPPTEPPTTTPPPTTEPPTPTPTTTKLPVTG
ncbi:hypothetical protein [Flexivirga sp. B27]